MKPKTMTDREQKLYDAATWALDLIACERNRLALNADEQAVFDEHRAAVDEAAA